MSADTGDRAARVLGFFPHPDDETYAAGGTLTLCARRGAEVTIVAATRGEAGVDLSGEAPPGPALGDRRWAELSDACRALGAAPPRCLDLPDGRVAAHDPADALRRLRATLELVRPDVVLTLGTDGVYGHVDHLACTALLETACASLPAAHRPRVLQAAFPLGLFGPVRRFLARLPESPVSPAVGPDDLGTTRAEVDLVVDIRAARDAKLRALGCHRSQLPGGDPQRFLKRGLISHLLGEEWFTVDAAQPPPTGRPPHPLHGLC